MPSHQHDVAGGVSPEDGRVTTAHEERRDEERLEAERPARRLGARGL